MFNLTEYGSIFVKDNFLDSSKFSTILFTQFVSSRILRSPYFCNEKKKLRRLLISKTFSRALQYNLS